MQDWFWMTGGEQSLYIYYSLTAGGALFWWIDSIHSNVCTCTYRSIILYLHTSTLQIESACMVHINTVRRH